jgi:hypothetical protein
MSLRPPAGDENGRSCHSINRETLTPIQPSPVEGEGSTPPLDGEDTGGVQQLPATYFQRSAEGHEESFSRKGAKGVCCLFEPFDYRSGQAPREIFLRSLAFARDDGLGRHFAFLASWVQPH